MQVIGLKMLKCQTEFIKKKRPYPDIPSWNLRIPSIKKRSFKILERKKSKTYKD